MTEENLIYYGGAVKVVGENRVGGYLVRFSDQNSPDLEGDFFAPDTDLGIETDSKLPVYYQHGYDSVLKSRRIGRADVKFDDIGVWLEAQLEMRDEYERSILELAEAGKLGWSSGAAGHLVSREAVGKSWKITSWPIAEASLTPTPAEPRNTAVSVKTLLNDQEKVEEPEPESQQQEVVMTEETKAPEIDVEALIKRVADETAKAIQAQEPPVKAAYNVDFVEDEADRELKGNPFGTFGEFLKSVRTAELRPYAIDKRLLPLKDKDEAKAALGMNEAIPSQGGFLVPQEFANGIRENMWGTGRVLSLFSPDPVQGNNMTVNLVDETSRADGSRNGGLLAYWEAEAATMTATKPKFRQVDLKLKRVTALVYATEEQLEDVAYMGSWLTRVVPDELRFKVEAAIFSGDGAGKPLGILPAGCLVSATRTDASEVDALDIGRMWSHRYLGSQDYVWFVNASVMPQLYQMVAGTLPVFVPPGGFSATPYGALFGRPVIETEYSPYLGTLGDILLASPSKYAMIDKGRGIRGDRSIHVAFTSWQEAFRFGYRCDGQPEWASAVTAYDGTNTVSPFVALAATT